MRRQGFGRWIEQLGRGQIVSGDVLRVPGSEQAVLNRQQIGSMAALPYFVNGAWRGFLGFEVQGGPPHLVARGTRSAEDRRQPDGRRAPAPGGRAVPAPKRGAACQPPERHPGPDASIRPNGIVLDVKAAPDGDLPERASMMGHSLDVFLPAGRAPNFSGSRRTPVENRAAAGIR